MKPSAIVAVLVTLLWTVCSGHPSQAVEKSPPLPKAVLTKPYTPQLGDMVALTTAQLLTGLKTVNAPMLAAYDRDSKRIDVFLYGQGVTLDRAKATLDQLRASMTGTMDLVGQIYGVKLDEKEFEYAYYDTSKGGVLVYWSGGTYTLGEQKEEGGD